MIKTNLSLYFPNRLGRTVLLTLEEVMEKSGLNALLKLSSLSHMIGNYPPKDENKVISFETISQLQVSLEQGYGPRGRCGLALRAGRVFFSHSLHSYNLELGLNDTAFRLQSPGRKLMSLLISLCHFVVGMLQEMLYWFRGGKYYNIVEQSCIAQGDPACLVCIDRLPLI